MGDRHGNHINILLLLAGIPFLSFLLIAFATSAYVKVQSHFLSPQRKRELTKELDEYDSLEENNPKLFNSMEKMKFYRFMAFVFALSYLVLFLLLILGIEI